MSRTRPALSVIVLLMVGVVYFGLIDSRDDSEVSLSPALDETTTHKVDHLGEADGVEDSAVGSADNTLRHDDEFRTGTTEQDDPSIPLAGTPGKPVSGFGVTSELAEVQAGRTSSPVSGSFRRFVEQGRAGYWAGNTESLVLDGIDFSAFGSTYSGWAVECKTTMCLTIASIDAEAYQSQQLLPQGGWMGMMLTIRNEIAPVVPFANDGVSGMHRDPETGRIWLMELWWLPEPEESP